MNNYYVLDLITRERLFGPTSEIEARKKSDQLNAEMQDSLYTEVSNTDFGIEYSKQKELI